jgi:hypothetical protein
MLLIERCDLINQASIYVHTYCNDDEYGILNLHVYYCTHTFHLQHQIPLPSEYLQTDNIVLIDAQAGRTAELLVISHRVRSL